MAQEGGLVGVRAACFHAGSHTDVCAQDGPSHALPPPPGTDDRGHAPLPPSFTGTRALLSGREPPSCQPVNQPVNTAQIRGDYQAVIVPEGSPGGGHGLMRLGLRGFRVMLKRNKRVLHLLFFLLLSARQCYCLQTQIAALTFQTYISVLEILYISTI